MTLTIHAEMLQGSDDWHDIRRGIVTASTVGKLITPKTVKVASNDESRGLVALLVAERITGYTEPTWTNDDMMRGHEVEPIARDWYANSRGVSVEQVGFMVLDKWGTRFGYSPDGLVGTDGLIEVKAPRAKTHIRTHVSREMPLSHMAQVQAGMLVADRSWCDFISYTGGLPPFVQRIHRDQRWSEVIVEAIEKFEADAAAMTSTYLTNTDGLPNTDRLPDLAEITFS